MNFLTEHAIRNNRNINLKEYKFHRCFDKASRLFLFETPGQRGKLTRIPSCSYNKKKSRSLREGYRKFELRIEKEKVSAHFSIFITEEILGYSFLTTCRLVQTDKLTQYGISI